MASHIITALCFSSEIWGRGGGVKVESTREGVGHMLTSPAPWLLVCFCSAQVDAYGNILLTTLEMNNEVMPSDVGSSVSDSRNSVMSFDSSGVQFRKPMTPRDGFSHHSLDRRAVRSRANCRLRRRSSKLKLKIPNLSDVSTIDKWSRVIFPITFGFFNLIYWLYYVNWCASH